LNLSFERHLACDTEGGDWKWGDRQGLSCYLLVAVTMKRLAEMFAAERARLEGQWDPGGNVSTEDLRLALRRYRSFFGRLLAV